MNYRVGDKVKFLNDVGGGTIISFIDKKLASVQMDDGFEVPVKVSELLPDPEFSNTMGNTPGNSYQGKEDASTEAEKPEDTIDTGIGEDFTAVNDYADEVKFYLIFVPMDEKNMFLSGFEVYLINDCDYNILFHSAILNDKDEDQVKYLEAGILESDTKYMIGELSWNQIKRNDSIMVQSICYAGESYKYQEARETYFDLQLLKNRDLNYFASSDFFDGKVFLYSLTETFSEDKLAMSDHELERIIKEKESKEKPIVPKPKKDPRAVHEVDLHIHELLDDYRGLSNGEILNIQMEHFIEELENARKEKKGRVVFIHGVGNGKLKYEIHRVLDHKYAHLKYQDASFREYGYGATMVFVK
jgi:hypothetical protein